MAADRLEAVSDADTTAKSRVSAISERKLTSKMSRLAIDSRNAQADVTKAHDEAPLGYVEVEGKIVPRRSIMDHINDWAEEEEEERRRLERAKMPVRRPLKTQSKRQAPARRAVPEPKPRAGSRVAKRTPQRRRIKQSVLAKMSQ